MGLWEPVLHVSVDKDSEWLPLKTNEGFDLVKDVQPAIVYDLM